MGRTVAVSALVGGAVFSVLVLFAPSVDISYENTNLHVALNAFEGTIAAVLAYLWSGRFRVDRRLRDALLVIAFGIFAAASLVLAALPQSAVHEPGLLWTAVVWRLGGASAFTAAAFAGRRRVARWKSLVVVAAVVVVAGGIAGLIGRRSDLGLLGIDIPSSPSLSSFHGHALLRGAHVAGLLLYASAAAAFWRGAARTNDTVLHFLSAGAVLGAFARVHFVLFPSLYTDLVYTGDALRFAAYAAFTIAGALEIRRYWRAVASDAVAAERRRTARELHDGIVQELAFIRLRLSAFASEAGDALKDVAESAQRALTESRQLIPILAEQQPEPEALLPLLQATVDDAAARFRVCGELRASASPVVPGGVAWALARVVREAISNGAVHGRATTVQVQLSASGNRLMLAVRDDGSGFDPAAVKATGFGLTSMRERVEGLGGELTVSSVVGRGTEVRLEVPVGRVGRSTSRTTAPPAGARR